MNIIIPLAGKDSRFPNMPKPLVHAGGMPLIAHVVRHLRIEQGDQLIFIVLQEDVEKYAIDVAVQSVAGGNAIVRILPHITQGSPCSILDAARDLIDNDTDLLVALGDVICDIGGLYRDIEARRAGVAGIIPVELLNRTGERWGYVQADEKGMVSALFEKEATYVAPWATMGLYYFSHGKDFVWAAEEMIKNKSYLYKDMFFIGPAYNELVRRGDTIIISQNKMLVELRGPEDVEKFISTLSAEND